MILSTVLSYLPYAAVTAFTPGPNNIVALYAVSQNGWRKGKDTLLGIGLGFLAVMVLCAVFCYELSRYIPAVSGVLKYVGAAYIVYLAVHVARSRPDNGGGRAVSFGKGILLQFVNVKIIMYAVTAYTGYVLPVSDSLNFVLAHALCFTVIGLAGTVTWAAAGGILKDFLARHYRPFNLLMAGILVLCAVKILM